MESKTIIIVSSVVTCVIAIVLAIVLWRRRDKTNVLNEDAVVTTSPTPQPATMSAEPDEVTIGPEKMTDYGLVPFSFEHKILGPGIKPDATATMTRVNQAEDDFVLVQCGMASGYAIRWMGRYLNVTPTGSVEWNVRKSEPDACWSIEAGYCGDAGEFVMMRSRLNGRFLRVDGATKKLVCVDSPSTENTAQYCWRLKKTDPIRRRCGTYYDKEYGRVISVPCEIIQDPPQGGSCLDVTPGFVAKCCLKHNDARCRSVVAREVVGRKISEAGLYLKSRFPNHVVELCADGDECEKAEPFPIHDSNKWVVRYNKRLGTVSFPAYRFF